MLQMGRASIFPTMVHPPYDGASLDEPPLPRAARISNCSTPGDEARI